MHGRDCNGFEVVSKLQIADVTKPFSGTIESVKRQNNIVFDMDEQGKNNSYIWNKIQKMLIPIDLENRGDFAYDLYVPKANVLNQVGEENFEPEKVP